MNYQLIVVVLFALVIVHWLLFVSVGQIWTRGKLWPSAVTVLGLGAALAIVMLSGCCLLPWSAQDLQTVCERPNMDLHCLGYERRAAIANGQNVK